MEQLKEKLLNLEKNNDTKNEIIKLMKEVKEKDKEIQELKSRFPFELKEGEKLMTVIFTSVDQKIHYSIICKNTDNFTVVENKLYDKYSEYRESINYFMFKGGKINKYKSLEDNNIKNSEVILLKNYDDD